MMKIFKKLNQRKLQSENETVPPASPDNQASDLIDVRQLVKELSVEALNESAEDYFARLESWEHQLSKPFADTIETPELLVSFAHVLQGLALAPGMRSEERR